MSELIPINITIADRTYRLKIDKADEETVRRTVKIINDKVFEYKSNLAGKDMQDFVSMALLWFATEQTKNSNNILSNKAIEDELNNIEQLLNKSIN
ncbi:MAG: cell division protein ZapA [Chitinophagaceae bacterium]